ncbi:MAG TPA: glycosyltransferase family 4 protein [Polyangiaceae bacterium]|nr:glycosyltransferase family 4 protein [Polyangiaceae bacterium]
MFSAAGWPGSGFCALRIALNFATARGAGSSRVAKGILGGLQSLRAPHVYLVFVPEQWPASPMLDGRFCVHKSRSGVFAKWAHESIRLPLEMRQGGFDKLFSGQDTGPPWPLVPELLLVQQAYLAYSPAEWGFTVGGRFALRMQLMARYFQMGLPRVRLFTVQTEDMRTHLVNRWQIDPARIHVVPSSADFVVRRAPVPHATPPYLIYVSAAAPHKNYLVLAEMLAILRGEFPELKLKLTTREEEVPEFVARAKALGVHSQVEYLGIMKREALERELAEAAAAVIPSKLESFGLTYYEALALGVPVVAADLGFAREACGEAGLYAHPDAGEDFAAGVRRLISSAETRADYVQRSLKRFDEVNVSWSEIASRYLALIERL